VTRYDDDVAQVLETLRKQVRARRLARAENDRVTDDQTAHELVVAVQDVNINAKVNSHLPLLWEDPVLGRLRAIVQLVVRRLLRWYINPIVDQQNNFNAAAARALTLLAAENARLRRDLTALQARLEDMEAKEP